MSRYRSDEATIWVWDEYDRTCLRWRSTDYWDSIRCALKDYFPQHGSLSYNATRKLWSVPLWQGARLEQWLLWTFEPSAIRWDEEPAGQYGRTYGSHSGYSQYRRPQTSTSTVEAAYAHLCLTSDAPADLVKTVHHWWVRQLHPDTGGDAARMAGINAAVDVIREQQERKAS